MLQTAATLILIIALLSCTKKENNTAAVIFPPQSQEKENSQELKQTAAVTEAPAPKNEVVKNQQDTADKHESKSSMNETKAAAELSWLAKLASFSNSVEYRPKQESVWKQASDEVRFVRFDALQTKSNSSANVLYQSGTALDVKENTLIIFDQDPGKKKLSEDRVIVKNGELVGSTKSELWIFTKGGLVQLKSEKKQKQPTKARINLRDEKVLYVKVESGSADVVYEKEQKFEKAKVAVNSDIKIFVNEQAEKDFSSEKQVEKLTEAATKTDKVSRAELKVEYPSDGTAVNQEKIEIKAKLSGPGAKVLINGKLAEIKSDLSISHTEMLVPGTNLIVFQLIRSDLSVQFIRINVRRLQ